MALDTVTLALDGEVPLEEFARAVMHFNDLVKTLSAEVGDPALDWIIDDLEFSSAVATARATNDPESAEQVVNAYAELGAALESNTPVPYSQKVRSAAQRVVSISDARVKSVRFETAIREATVPVVPGKLILIPADTSQPSRRVAPSPAIVPAASFGGIQGRVQTLSNRGSLRFTLYDLLNNKAVSCYIAEGKEETLRNIWGRMAVVEGLVTRDSVNGRPISIRQVRNIIPQQEPCIGHDYQDARGVSPSLTGLSPEEAIRRIRDAQ